METVHGSEPFRIPPGTQPSQVFRLRGKGVPFVDGSGRGDHYIHAAVTIPTVLTSEQRELLEQFAVLSGDDVSESRGMLDKVKDFFTG